MSHKGGGGGGWNDSNCHMGGGGLKSVEKRKFHALFEWSLKHLGSIRLRPQDVTHKLGNPPHAWITVKPNDPFWQISWNGRRKKLRSWVDFIDDWKFNDEFFWTWPGGVVPWWHFGTVFAQWLEHILEREKADWSNNVLSKMIWHYFFYCWTLDLVNWQSSWSSLVMK